VHSCANTRYAVAHSKCTTQRVRYNHNYFPRYNLITTIFYYTITIIFYHTITIIFYYTITIIFYRRMCNVEYLIQTSISALARVHGSSGSGEVLRGGGSWRSIFLRFSFHDSRFQSIFLRLSYHSCSSIKYFSLQSRNIKLESNFLPFKNI
jgi:hypothetical protein